MRFTTCRRNSAMIVLQSITPVFIVIFMIVIIYQTLTDKKMSNQTMVGYIAILLVYALSIICMWS